MNAHLEALRLLVASGAIPTEGPGVSWDESVLQMAGQRILNLAAQIMAERNQGQGGQKEPPKDSE